MTYENSEFGWHFLNGMTYLVFTLAFFVYWDGVLGVFGIWDDLFVTRDGTLVFGTVYLVF